MGKYRSGAFIAAGVAVIGILASGNATAAPTKSVNAACGSPTIVAEPGVATFGTPGRDIILGTPGDDDIYGDAGNDVICGEGGNDHLFGDAGRDEIYGGDGDDVIWLVDETDDSLTDCGGGHDQVTTDWEPLDRNLRDCEEIA